MYNYRIVGPCTSHNRALAKVACLGCPSILVVTIPPKIVLHVYTIKLKALHATTGCKKDRFMADTSYDKCVCVVHLFHTCGLIPCVFLCFCTHVCHLSCGILGI